jgi:hypothetical protein
MAFESKEREVSDVVGELARPLQRRLRVVCLNMGVDGTAALDNDHDTDIVPDNHDQHGRVTPVGYPLDTPQGGSASDLLRFEIQEHTATVTCTLRRVPIKITEIVLQARSKTWRKRGSADIHPDAVRRTPGDRLQPHEIAAEQQS